MVGVNKPSSGFKRFYKTSPGVFFGCNLWIGLELYICLESQTFDIEQKSIGIHKDIHTFDSGLGLSYQSIIGRYFYIQPGMHVYVRSNNNIDFGDVTYSIPNVDFSPLSGWESGYGAKINNLPCMYKHFYTECNFSV